MRAVTFIVDLAVNLVMSLFYHPLHLDHFWCEKCKRGNLSNYYRVRCRCGKLMERI